MLTPKVIGCVCVIAVLSACRGGDNQSSRRPAPKPRVAIMAVDRLHRQVAWPVLELVESQENKTVGVFVGNANGYVAVDVPDGKYVLQLTASVGNFVGEFKLVSGEQQVVVDENCVVVRGTAGGDINVGETVWLQQVSTQHYFGALVLPDRTFTACVPAGSYSMEAFDDEEAPAYVFNAPTEIQFSAYEPAVIDQPLPEGVGMPQRRAAPPVPENATVIGIGEPTHGAREFLGVRLQETLRLARERGVRYIAIEAGAAEVFPLDDYIHGKAVDVRASVAALGYWMWDTEEMLGALDELRSYNKHVPSADRVNLVGIDVQKSARAAEYLLAASHVWDGGQRAALEAAARVESLTDMEFTVARRHVAALEAAARAGGEWQAELRSAMSFRQVVARLHMYVPDSYQPWIPREQGMATMVEELLRFTGRSSVVIWAHNAHVNADVDSDHEPLGSRLRSLLGDRYCAMGLLMGGGAFRAWDAEQKVGVVVHNVDRPPPASLEALMLRDAGDAPQYVSLREVSPAMVSWLSVPRRTLEDVGIVTKNYRWPLRRHLPGFDVVGLIPRVSPTTPTETGRRTVEHR